MKRLLLILSVVLWGIPGFSQNALAIHQKDGQEVCFGFSEKPVIKYTEDELVLKTVSTEVYYRLATIAKITYVDEQNDSKEEKKQSSISLTRNFTTSIENHYVRISGTKPDATVFIYSIDGKIWGRYKADSEGRATFSISELRTGVYIIKSESQTCKIVKK